MESYRTGRSVYSKFRLATAGKGLVGLVIVGGCAAAFVVAVQRRFNETSRIVEEAILAGNLGELLFDWLRVGLVLYGVLAVLLLAFVIWSRRRQTRSVQRTRAVVGSAPNDS